jgi:twinkle protein
VNDILLQADDIDFAEYMRDSEPEYRVKPVSHWEDDLIAEFADCEAGDPSPKLPWANLHKRIAIRPGEVSLWFGYSGHGKSLLLGQAMLSAAAQGERVCIGSFEMRPRKTLGRMVRQHADDYRPAPSAVRAFSAWAKGRMWVYDQTGTVEPARIYAVIRYAVENLKVTQFVVDNLTKCTQADDDYAGQKAIVDKLTALAQSLNIHIHLVHHARKGSDETRPPRKLDALGASAITNLVDNVFIVWRNKAKYEKPEVDERQPDAMIIIDKQRHGSGWEGVQNMTFHQRSNQYIEAGSTAMDLSHFPHGWLS